MKAFLRSPIRLLLRSLARYPRMKRSLVDLVYKIPALDSLLRTAANRLTHPEARLDVDASQLPEGSRRSFERMRSGMPR